MNRMAAHPSHNAPKQARSRRSLRRLLDAAESAFDKYGLEGATVPRIARAAGLSPASVYRRFRDKDDLIRAVFRRASEIQIEELAKEVDLEQMRKVGIRNFTNHWIGGMLRGYGKRTGLIRAAMMYGQRHPHAAFVRRQQALEIQNFRRLVQIFLLWRDEIRHPKPERAITYGAMMVAFTARELILFGQAEAFEALVPVGNDDLQRELSRAFLTYLDVELGEFGGQHSPPKMR